MNQFVGYNFFTWNTKWVKEKFYIVSFFLFASLKLPDLLLNSSFLKTTVQQVSENFNVQFVILRNSGRIAQ